MRYGLEIPNGGTCADPRVVARLARAAEDAGWDGVFLEDYIGYWSQPACPTADTWVSLTAIALATTRIRLGTTVTALSRRRPWKLAREAVSVDLVSEGRLTLAVGLGDINDPGFACFNEESDSRKRARRLDEGLAILDGLWTGEPFSFSGDHYTVEGAHFLPRPVQRPRIPIWVGGGWPRRAVVDRAAGWDGMCPYRFDPDNPYRDAPETLGPDEVRQIAADIAARRGSLEDFDVVIGGRERIADTEARQHLVADLEDAGATWWMEWVPDAPREVMEAAITRGPLPASP